MHFHTALVASTFAALATAQTIATSSASSVAATRTQSQSMPATATQGFDANNVTSSTKFQWCLAQTQTCPQICGGAASVNSCDPTSLMYSCVCPNATAVDSTAYIQTLPYFVCQETFAQCNRAHPNDAEGQSTCMNNEKCGTRNATAEALAVTSAAAATSASSTGGAKSSASSGASGASSAASSAAASTTASKAGAAAMSTVTSGAFAAALMAMFRFLL